MDYSYIIKGSCDHINHLSKGVRKTKYVRQCQAQRKIPIVGSIIEQLQERDVKGLGGNCGRRGTVYVGENKRALGMSAFQSLLKMALGF